MNEKLAEFIKQHNLTKAQVARMLYVTEDCVYKWLNGSRPMSPAYLELAQLKMEKLNEQQTL